MPNSFQVAAKSKLTTLGGSTLSILAGLMILLPEDVRTGCLEAIQQSENPLIVGILAVLGIILTAIGPSLAQKAKSGQHNPGDVES